MGDRCDMTVTLRGRIETIEILEQIVEGIVSEFSLDRDEVIRDINEALDQGKNAEFLIGEVNYGRADELELLLKSLNIDYTMNHSDGGGYPGQDWSFNSSSGEVCTSYHAFGERIVYLSDLEKVFNTDDPIDNIRSLINNFEKSTGKYLPTFSASHEVRGWLAIGGPSLNQKREEE